MKSYKKFALGGMVIALVLFSIAFSGSMREYLGGQILIPRAFVDTIPGIIADENGEIFLSHAGITMQVPYYYSVKQSKNVFASKKELEYDFVYLDEPTKKSWVLQKINFFTAPNLEFFFQNCEDSLCYFGELGDTTQYSDQFSVFPGSDGKVYSEELVQFNDRNYLVMQEPCLNEECFIRKYRTYYKNTRVDLYVKIRNRSDSQKADSLVEEFGIY